MTSRERILAVVRGETPDQTPVIVWPSGEYHSDAGVVKINRLGNAASSPRAVFAEILNPFGRALKAQVDLNAVLHDNPEQGAATLSDFITETVREIEFAMNSGADGIFYRLQGAEPKYCTPMQYGGHFLEVDRAMLELATRINIVFLDCGGDGYVDCLTDLPAQVFAWDKDATPIQLSEMRRYCTRLLATGDANADILFGPNYGILQSFVKKLVSEAHV